METQSKERKIDSMSKGTISTGMGIDPISGGHVRHITMDDGTRYTISTSMEIDPMTGGHKLNITEDTGHHQRCSYVTTKDCLIQLLKSGILPLVFLSFVFWSLCTWIPALVLYFQG